jgi:adenosylhomocysteine nucleosidase
LTTAILSALADEQRGLIEQLKHPVKMVRAGREFWCGELHGQPVVLALSKIGKVAAATTATTLIEAFKAQRIVFTGVAGGLGAGVKVGDVVVATEFFQHDMDASPLFPRYEIPLYGRTLFSCDAHLSALLLEAAQASCTSPENIFDLSYSAPQRAVHSGPMTSGDRFVSGASESVDLQAALHAQGLVPLAVEMEGAAVAQVCFDYGIPFAAVRTISDRADDQAHVDFPRFVVEVASVYALAIVNELMRMLPKK